MSQTRKRLLDQFTALLAEKGINDEELARALVAIARPETKPAIEIPPAVLAYQAGMGRYPPKDIWESMDQAIGRVEAETARWQEHCRNWKLKGYNPGNLIGLHESFKTAPDNTKAANADGSFYV